MAWISHWEYNFKASSRELDTKIFPFVAIEINNKIKENGFEKHPLQTLPWRLKMPSIICLL